MFLYQPEHFKRSMLLKIMLFGKLINMLNASYSFFRVIHLLFQALNMFHIWFLLHNRYENIKSY